jgi:hypothetical protein
MPTLGALADPNSEKKHGGRKWEEKEGGLIVGKKVTWGWKNHPFYNVGTHQG